MSKRWTAEEDRKVLEMRAAGANWDQVAKAISTPDQPVTARAARGRQPHLSGKSDQQEQDCDHGPRWTIEGDGNVQTCVSYVELKGPIRSPEELIERAGIEYDKELWQIDRVECGAWTTPVKTGTKQVSKDPVEWHVGVSVVQNYRVVVKFKRREPLSPERVKADLIEELKAFAPKYPKVARVKARKTGLYMLEICIFDLHFGKYAWEPETGTNYDINIAEKAFESSLESLIARTAGYPLDHILLPIGNDLFHIDNAENTTAHGTRQDVDTRVKHVAKRGRQMLVKAIDTLQQLAPVHIKVVPGNHDALVTFMVGDAIECQYHKCRDVTVDNGPRTRKYHAWRNVLLGFTHGSIASEMTRLPGLMPIEMPQAWPASKFREYHLGHLHKKGAHKHHMSESDTGIVVRTMQSLSGTDAWHFEHGYVGGPRAASALLWGEKHGCECELTAYADDSLYQKDAT